MSDSGWNGMTRAESRCSRGLCNGHLLPPLLSPPEGLDASAYYHTASADDVGGDFYDLFPLSHDKWAFFIGDVSGKGAGAAAVTALTRYTLESSRGLRRRPCRGVAEPACCLESRSFRDTVNQFATVIFGILTPHDGEFGIELASAGHLPFVRAWRQWRGALRGHHRWPARRHPHWSRNSSLRGFGLDQGDTLVLYTDGLTEARISDGAERYDYYGALLEFAAAQAPTTASAIVASIKSLLDGFGSGCGG